MDRPKPGTLCGECEKPINPDHPAVIYDGEWCHLSCAAEAQDNAGFDGHIRD